MGNFIECMRDRKRPVADIDAGFGHAVATVLSDLSFRKGVRMEYDAEAREMKAAKLAEI